MRIEHTSAFNRIFCDCGAELRSANDMALHRRRHLLERTASTPEGRRTLEMLRHAGFKDQPDPWFGTNPPTDRDERS